MKYLFLDTNIFIHYKGYEDIPWQSLLDTLDSVKVVLASIVLREINGHKDNSKGRVRNKARKISEKFNNILITRVRDNILKSKEQKNIQPTKGGHKMVTCQNYVSLFYRQITSCPSDGGIS